MPVPYEALLPYGIMLGMFAVSGVGLATLKAWENDWKRPRYNLDKWDEQMMARDKRLTGTDRGQTDQIRPPAGFELSKGWKIEKSI